MAYAEPDEVREWMGLTDTNLDGLFSPAIVAAEEWINGFCHRTFELDTVATPRDFDVSADGSVHTDDIGNATVTVATDENRTGTYSTWSASDFQLLPLSRGYRARPYYRITPTGGRWFPWYGGGYPLRSGLVRVTARWGWPAVPGAVKQACVMQAARIVNRRSSPNGVAGFNDLGVVRVSGVDRDIEAMLADVRLMG